MLKVQRFRRSQHLRVIMAIVLAVAMFLPLLGNVSFAAQPGTKAVDEAGTNTNPTVNTVGDEVYSMNDFRVTKNPPKDAKAKIEVNDPGIEVWENVEQKFNTDNDPNIAFGDDVATYYGHNAFPQFYEDLAETIYPKFAKGYTGTNFYIPREVIEKNPDVAITVIWDQGGKIYNGDEFVEDVQITATFKNIIYRKVAQGTKGRGSSNLDGVVFSISDAFSSGWQKMNAEAFEVELDFVGAESGKQIEATDNSFITFGSLNGYHGYPSANSPRPGLIGGREFAAYINQEPGKMTYKLQGSPRPEDEWKAVADRTWEGGNVKEREYRSLNSRLEEAGITGGQDFIKDHPNNSYFDGIKIFSGESNDFTDDLFARNFMNNAITFQLNSKGPHRFVMGTYATHEGSLDEAKNGGSGAGWAFVSTATVFKVKPFEPTKTVSDNDEFDVVENTYAEENETHIYKVSQENYTLSENGTGLYNSYVLKDMLPEEVDYVSSRMLIDGEEVQLTNDPVYDEETHTVTWEATETELGSYSITGDLSTVLEINHGTFEMDGEVVTLEITVTPNEKAAAKPRGEFRNEGIAIIDGEEQVSNEVVSANKPVRDPSINPLVAEIVKDVEGQEEYVVPVDTEYTYHVNAKVTEDKLDVESLFLTDTLEPVLELVDAKATVNGEINEDLFDVVLDGQTVTATALDMETLEGITDIGLEITAKIKADADLSEYQDEKVPNFATITASVYGDEDEPSEKTEHSNEVYVTPEKESAPGIQLEKTSDTVEIDRSMSEVIYEFKITNTGNEDLTDLVLHDEKLGGDLLLPQTELAVGESFTFTLGYPLTEEDFNAKSVYNIAKVTGFGEDKEKPVEDEDDYDIPVIAPQLKPSIQLEKKVDKDRTTGVGDTLVYTFVITNNGDEALENIVLSDSMLGGSLELPKTLLNIGESMEVTVEHVVTEKDVFENFVPNKAKVTGKGIETGGKVESEDEVKVPLSEPSIKLEKMADKKSTSGVGDEIEYSFVITNDGGEDLKNIVLEDEMLGGKIDLSKTELSVGESMTVKVKHVLTENDIKDDIVENTATVTGEGVDSGGKVESGDKVRIPLAKPSIKLEKTADKKFIKEAGEKVLYTFTITNDGKEDLKDLVLVDEMLGGTIKLDQTTLAAGKSVQVEKEYETTEEDLGALEIKNLAKVTAVGEISNREVESEDEVVIPVTDPSIQLEKTSNKKLITKEGEIVTYMFTITNNGSEALKDIVLEDEMLGGKLDLPKTELGIGESMTATKDYVVGEKDLDKDLKNIAKVTGVGVLSGKTTESDGTVTIPVQKTKPSINLVKAADVDRIYSAGDVVTYRFTITNDGNEDLEHVVLHDEMLGGEIALEDQNLRVGESMTVEVMYRTTEDDLKRDALENTATVTGDGVLSGTKVESTDIHTIPLLTGKTPPPTNDMGMVGRVVGGLLIVLVGAGAYLYTKKKETSK